MTALLIDDEPAAINLLRELINDFTPSVDIIGTARGVTEGLGAIRTLRPELIFLDVQMEDGTGFDLLSRLQKGERPEVIFATSMENQAIRAIQSAALGFLVKPIGAKELIQAVENVRQRVGQNSVNQKLDALIDNIKSPKDMHNLIGVPDESGTQFLEVGRITHCEGAKGCTLIHHLDGKPLLSSYPLGNFREQLEAYDFLAVHRSYVVNLKQVRRYENSGSLVLVNDISVPVSRAHRSELAKRFGK